jgi:hypothetical protein
VSQVSQLIFQRVEKKYMVDPRQHRAMLSLIDEYMEPDQYPDYQVCNIYYDTEDYRLIRESLAHPKYKEKLRLRCYGQPDDSSNSFVELKKKYNGVVYKRRLEMPLGEARAWLDGRAPAPDSQVGRELAYALDHYQLIPRMVLLCHRRAWHGRENPELRLTFDDHILWRSEDLDLTAPPVGRALLEPGQRLMELKIPGAMPLWLAAAMNEQQIWPTSFSKYGHAYQTMMTELRKGAVHYA